MQPSKPRSAKEARIFIASVAVRGAALFLGAFSLLNVAGNFFSRDFDANLWVVDLRRFSHPWVQGFLGIAGVLLIMAALRPPRGGVRRWTTAVVAGLLAAMALVNTAQFYILVLSGALVSRMPIPLSLFLCAGLTAVVIMVLRADNLPVGKKSVAASFGVAMACLFLFPLAQMLFFGKTDYRRPADAAVVFGARAYANGRPSDALADRVRTGCQLYQQGLTRKLIFSGGPGDGPTHETESMKNLAKRLGVPDEDIILDEKGVNTQATVENTEPILRDLGARRVLVVSHFYHLPRIKMAYQREGREVWTVPAKETYALRQLPYNMAREVAALWVYYLRPLNHASLKHDGSA